MLPSELCELQLQFSGNTARQEKSLCPSFILWCTILLLYVFIPLSEESLQGEFQRKLYKDLLKNYNPLERPVANDSQPLTVYFTLSLMQIMDVVSLYPSRKLFLYKGRFFSFLECRLLIAKEDCKTLESTNNSRYNAKFWLPFKRSKLKSKVCFFLRSQYFSTFLAVSNILNEAQPAYCAFWILLRTSKKCWL